MSGVTFGIYSDEDCTEAVGDLITIENENAVVELNVGTYYVKVVDVPDRYALSDSVYSVDIIAGDTVELAIEVELRKYTISAGYHEGGESSPTLITEPSLPLEVVEGSDLSLLIGLISAYEGIIVIPPGDTYSLILFDNSVGTILLEGMSSLTYTVDPGELGDIRYNLSNISENHVLSLDYYIEPIDESILGN